MNTQCRGLLYQPWLAMSAVAFSMISLIVYKMLTRVLKCKEPRPSLLGRELRRVCLGNKIITEHNIQYFIRNSCLHPFLDFFELESRVSLFTFSLDEAY